MSSVERVSGLSEQFVTVIAEPKDVATEALGWQDAGLVVRAVRGPKTRTITGFFDEFAAAFQFPYYFGENWAAFQDCVSDLSWLPFRPGVVVLIYGAGQVLADAHSAELPTLVQVLSSAADEFAHPVNDGEWWDRDAVPFHVVLQGFAGGDFERWSSAGANLAPMT
jgi:hypothetical protein